MILWKPISEAPKQHGSRLLLAYVPPYCRGRSFTVGEWLGRWCHFDRGYGGYIDIDPTHFSEINLPDDTQEN